MIVDHALKLASKGFYVFPLKPHEKTPAVSAWQELATRDPATIKRWWSANHLFNVGIYTGKFNGDGETLIAIDVDNKGEKKGDESLMQLEAEGLILPKTCYQETPTGGKHLIYRAKDKFANSVGKLAEGLDIRSHGGYLVGAGSIVNSKEYLFFDFEVVEATEQLISRLNKAREKKPIENIPLNIDEDRAIQSAIKYLLAAPIALQGSAGDQTTYQVACGLKDIGLTFLQAFDVMAEHWNPRCEPPWDIEDLQNKIRNAYQYGQEPPGSKNPEVLFDELPKANNKHPIEKMNENHAFIIVGGKSFVLRESKDSVNFLAVQAFHQRFKSEVVMFGDKTSQVTNLWMASKNRRTYDGLCFDPSESNEASIYNLWKGYKIKPKPAANEKAKIALETYLEHLKENICHGNVDHFNWLITFFAHLIQKPYEKPIVSVVLRGQKGVGKNILVETLGHLLDPYFILASNNRFLTGNFNSHLEKCLMFVLDEAFWSGDKKSEGALKDVITGKTHFIERKGFEPYLSKNLTRVFILGNDDWLVPASHDERRFAVFDVSNKRKQDSEYFGKIIDGMKVGGYEALFDYLNKVDISKIDLRYAPQTSGLADQKVNSLSVFHEFWLESLEAGTILESGLETWPIEISKEDLRQSYRRYAKEKGATIWLNSGGLITKSLKKCLPNLKEGRIGKGERQRTYLIDTLDSARSSWDRFMGYQHNWPSDS